MEVKKIQDVLVKSTMGVGQALDSLKDTIEIVSKKLSDEEVVLVLLKAKRGLEAELNGKIWREDISKPVEYPKMDYKSLISYFYSQYPKMYGMIEPHDYFKDAVSKLAAIISRDVDKCQELNVDQEKSALLYGGTGVGKTSIMKCFAVILRMLNNPSYPTFRTVNTIDISNEFKREGAICFNKYTNLVNEGNLKGAGWYFDDLGTEDKANNYGNSSNVMEEIILILEKSHSMGGNTHFSTNLSGDDMIEKYGDRVFSRLNKMCNVINFPADAVDMRMG